MNTLILKGIVDRFEADLAVIELDTGKILNVPKFLLETEIRPGDAIICMPAKDIGYHAKPNPIWKLDAEATKERRERIQELIQDVKKPKKKKGKEL